MEIGKQIRNIENGQLKGDEGQNESSSNGIGEQEICRILKRQNY